MSQSKPEKSGRFKVLVVGVSLYVMGVLIWDMVGVGKAQRQMDQAREKVEILQTEQADLQRQLAVVSSDEFREEQIRDELLLAREGETVVVVPQLGVDQVNQVDKDNRENQVELANWQKWAKLFL